MFLCLCLGLPRPGYALRQGIEGRTEDLLSSGLEESPQAETSTGLAFRKRIGDRDVVLSGWVRESREFVDELIAIYGANEPLRRKASDPGEIRGLSARPSMERKDLPQEVRKVKTLGELKTFLDQKKNSGLLISFAQLTNPRYFTLYIAVASSSKRWWWTNGPNAPLQMAKMKALVKTLKQRATRGETRRPFAKAQKSGLEEDGLRRSLAEGYERVDWSERNAEVHGVSKKQVEGVHYRQQGAGLLKQRHPPRVIVPSSENPSEILVVLVDPETAVRLPTQPGIVLGSADHRECAVCLGIGWDPQRDRWELFQWHYFPSALSLPETIPELFRGLQKVQVVLSRLEDTSVLARWRADFLQEEWDRQLRESWPDPHAIGEGIRSVTLVPRAKGVAVSTVVTAEGIGIYLLEKGSSLGEAPPWLVKKEVLVDDQEGFRSLGWNELKTGSLPTLYLAAQPGQFAGLEEVLGFATSVEELADLAGVPAGKIYWVRNPPEEQELRDFLFNDRRRRYEIYGVSASGAPVLLVEPIPVGSPSQHRRTMCRPDRLGKGRGSVEFQIRTRRRSDYPLEADFKSLTPSAPLKAPRRSFLYGVETRRLIEFGVGGSGLKGGIDNPSDCLRLWRELSKGHPAESVLAGTDGWLLQNLSAQSFPSEKRLNALLGDVLPSGTPVAGQAGTYLFDLLAGWRGAPLTTAEDRSGNWLRFGGTLSLKELLPKAGPSRSAAPKKPVPPLFSVEKVLEGKDPLSEHLHSSEAQALGRSLGRWWKTDMNRIHASLQGRRQRYRKGEVTPETLPRLGRVIIRYSGQLSSKTSSLFPTLTDREIAAFCQKYWDPAGKGGIPPENRQISVRRMRSELARRTAAGLDLSLKNLNRAFRDIEKMVRTRPDYPAIMRQVKQIIAERQTDEQQRIDSAEEMQRLIREWQALSLAAADHLIRAAPQGENQPMGPRTRIRFLDQAQEAEGGQGILGGRAQRVTLREFRERLEESGGALSLRRSGTPADDWKRTGQLYLRILPPETERTTERVANWADELRQFLRAQKRELARLFSAPDSRSGLEEGVGLHFVRQAETASGLSDPSIRPGDIVELQELSSGEELDNFLRTALLQSEGRGGLQILGLRVGEKPSLLIGFMSAGQVGTPVERVREGISKQKRPSSMVFQLDVRPGFGPLPRQTDYPTHFDRMGEGPPMRHLLYYPAYLPDGLLLEYGKSAPDRGNPLFLLTHKDREAVSFRTPEDLYAYLKSRLPPGEDLAADLGPALRRIFRAPGRAALPVEAEDPLAVIAGIEGFTPTGRWFRLHKEGLRLAKFLQEEGFLPLQRRPRSGLPGDDSEEEEERDEDQEESEDRAARPSGETPSAPAEDLRLSKFPPLERILLLAAPFQVSRGRPHSDLDHDDAIRWMVWNWDFGKNRIRPKRRKAIPQEVREGKAVLLEQEGLVPSQEDFDRVLDRLERVFRHGRHAVIRRSARKRVEVMKRTEAQKKKRIERSLETSGDVVAQWQKKTIVLLETLVDRLGPEFPLIGSTRSRIQLLSGLHRAEMNLLFQKYREEKGGEDLTLKDILLLFQGDLQGKATLTPTVDAAGGIKLHLGRPDKLKNPMYSTVARRQLARLEQFLAEIDRTVPAEQEEGPRTNDPFTPAGLEEARYFERVEEFLEAFPAVRPQMPYFRRELGLPPADQLSVWAIPFLASAEEVGTETIEVYVYGGAGEEQEDWKKAVDEELNRHAHADRVYFSVKSYPTDGRMTSIRPAVIIQRADAALPAEPSELLARITLRDLRDAGHLSPAWVHGVALQESLRGRVLGPVKGVLMFEDEAGDRLFGVFA